MKLKRTLLKGGQARRLLSIVLTAALTVSTMPVSAFASGTGSTGSAAPVEYNRKSPESAILNYYTGNSQELYKQIKAAAANRHEDLSQYNAMAQVLGVPYNSSVPEATYTWGNDPNLYWPSGIYNTGVSYADSQIRALSNVYGNLEVNISADFTNDVHTHSHRHGINKYEYTVTNYTSVTLQMGSSTPVVIGGSYPENGLNYVRVGDYGGAKGNVSYNAKNPGDSYGKVPYSNSDTFELKVTENLGSYRDQGTVKTCTCDTNFSYAENMLLTFRDPLQPGLPTVYYSLDGESWTPSANGLRVKGGSTLYIKLSYYEPIRFADDSAAGKEALYLELQSDGASTGYEDRKAYLYKLDGNDLYFSYTFTQSGVDLNIQSLDMSSLFPANEVPLVQVNKKDRRDWANGNGALKGNFTLDSSLKNSENGTTGFTTTTCYITDLAGNALMKPAGGGLAAGNLILDSVNPYVKNVEFNLTLNNGDVKKELNKTDPSDNTSYTDNSDLYLGVGDKVGLVLNMNERLKVSTLRGCTAVATTNIKKADNSYVTVESKYCLPEAEGIERDITSCVMQPITLGAGWTVEDSQGQIKVTALRFVDNAGNNVDLASITDQAGNPLEKSAGDATSASIDPIANANPPWLDVTAPTVTPYGIETPEGTGFYYAVSISDDESGVTGLSGKFVLRNGTEAAGGDGRNYSFEYAVTQSADTPGTWKTGKTGVAYDFDQGTAVYIHIRPRRDETYTNLSACTLTVKTQDYAGNRSNVTLPPEGKTLNWYIDNAVPTVKAGETKRALNTEATGGGILTAEITLSDGKGISAWQYGWSDTKETEPISWEDGALDPGEIGPKSVTKTIVTPVQQGERFSQYLWVKATDNSNRQNTATVRLGLYTYDLSKTQYNLDYSPDVTVKAKMEVSSIGENDSLFFLVKPKDGSEYALLNVDGATSESGDIFSNSLTWVPRGYWSYGWTLNGENGIYTLTRTAGTGISSVMQDEILRGTYRGEVTVVLLTGKTVGAPSDILHTIITGNIGDELVLGTDAYHFSMDTVTLRAASHNQENFTGVTITTDSDLGGDQANHGAVSLEHPALSTLAGIEFRISIEADNYGWNYDDVDWEHSYVELNQGENSDVRYQFELRSVEAVDGKVTQTLTIPERDFKSGVYQAKLYLNCFAGYDIVRYMKEGDPLEGQTIYFVVDTVKPVSDFTFTLTYAPDEKAYYSPEDNAWHLSNRYGITGVYETRVCQSENGVITLPVADGTTFGTDYPGETYQFTVTSEAEQPADTSNAVSPYGWYQLQIWNKAYPENTLTIDPTDSSQKTVKSNDGTHSGNHAYGFVFAEDKIVGDSGNVQYIYLAKDTENTVCIRKAYANGTFSDLQEVRIRPVTQHITGTVSIDSATRQLVFTPTNALSTLGATIYAWAWQDGQDAVNKGEGQRINMTPAADGTWRCDLLENGAKYEVITLNSIGSVCDAGGCSAHAPILDTPTFTDTGNGTYELSFLVSDELDTVKDGMKLDIGFNDTYSADSVSLTLERGSKNWVSESTYEWTETDVSTTGIYSVKAVKYDSTEKDYLGVTVKGCYKSVTGVDMNITVTATDAMGYTASVSTGEQTVAYQQPVIYDEAVGDSNLKPTLGDNGLILNFSQPVQPVNSWAWQESDPDAAKGFRTQWEGAFPVAGKGTYELQFVDLFGSTCSQKLTVSADVFTKDGTDYSMDVAYSNTAQNASTVAVTASTPNGYLTFYGTGSRSGTLWEETDASGAYVYETTYVIQQLIANTDAEIWQKYSANSMTSEQAAYYYKNTGVKMRTVRWYSNDKMVIVCDSVPSSSQYTSRIFTQTVYISNIAPKTAPTAQVRYYACDLGQGFTQTQLEQYIADNGGSVTLTGNLRVWYETDRSVTPTEGDREFLFTPTNYQDSHTFTYVDDLNNEGSVTVALPAGLTLAAPANQPEDTIAPTVSVGMAAKRNGSYTQEGSFYYTEDSAAITQKFADLGYVQSCLLTIAASDVSGFTIAVSGDGAALSGNIVTITKAGTFAITVTDRSSNHNATVITFTVPPIIDMTPPTVKGITVSGDIYAKVLTITLADRNDTGNDTGEVTLSLPAEAVREESKTNTYTYTPSGNGIVEFEFYDQAGNRGTTKYLVSGIDTEPSELSVTWSPSREQYSELPPTGPINTDVTARIRSNKAMCDLTVRAANETSDHVLLAAGKALADPYSITGPDGKALVTFDVTPELVTVTYSGNYDQDLIFTASSPYSFGTELTLSGLYNVIDKTAPNIQAERTEIKRDGYSKPYAVKVTLKPTNELAASPNYGATDNLRQPVWYGSDHPLVLTFTEKGTYNVRFTDAAGNVTVTPVVIAEVDNKAPKLTVTTAEEINQVKVTATVDEPCTLTWGEDGTYTFTAAGSYGENGEITFSQNGTFAITATDSAGNESFKMVRVGSIDSEAPSISFTKNTIYVMEGSSDAALTAALNTGYTAWDNVTTSTPIVTHNGAAVVDLNTAGQYTVTYTVTDAAGNKTTANRFIRVIGSGTVCLNMDGNLVMPDSTVVLTPGSHRLTLENNNGEPYSVKARKGVLSAGQMKYISGSSLSFDESGNFSVADTGFYTLLVTTQSRQTIRILLYVEQ